MDDAAPTSTATAGATRENLTGRRIAAALIDVALLALVFVVMSLLFGGTDPDDTDSAGFTFRLTGLPFLVYLLVVFGYYIGTEAAWCQTAGKVLMGLRVVALDGSTAPRGAIVLRNILRIIDALPFLYIAGLVSIAVTKRHQRIGDLAANTVVVRT